MIYLVLRNSLGGELDRREIKPPLRPGNSIASTLAGLVLGEWSELAIGDSITVEGDDRP